VGGYFVWKKAKAKAQAKLAEVTQMAEQQAQQAEGETQEPSQEQAPSEEPAPSEPAPEAAPEPSPTEPAPSAEPVAPPPTSAPKPAKPKPAPTPAEAPKSDEAFKDAGTDQVNLDNLNKPLLPEPVPSAPAPAAAAQTATLGLILESQAPGIKFVVKVDGVKVYEQDMVASSAKQRITKELPVSSGAHHIRVAIWRPPQAPVAGEWDFTFDPGSHPVFRLDLGSDWKMEVKRFQ
jgi:outer membrane biosynthesis protein TonB